MFLESILREANAKCRQVMLDHANSDQINAISEMVLNLLKQNIPINASTFSKLKRYKTVLRELQSRTNSVKRRREHLKSQTGSGFKQLLQSMLSTLRSRDKDGYPPEGQDVVPERKKDADVLSVVVKLLKDANERVNRLQDEKDHWYKRYQDLYQDYIVLKFSDICHNCQTRAKENTASSDEVFLCKDCKEGKQTIQSLKQDLQKQGLVRYWQECYETFLQQHLLLDP